MTIQTVLYQLLPQTHHERLEGIAKLPTGFNSTLYKLTTDNGSTYIAKQYSLRNGDHRDRLSTEFYGLSYLWSHGIRSVPEPITLSLTHQIGVYRFINGKKLTPHDVAPEHIHQAAIFLKSLYALSKAKDASKLPIASEACFTIDGFIISIEQRRRRLKSAPRKAKTIQELHHFLDDEFFPVYKELLSFIVSECKRMEIDVHRPIRKYQMTLSPSDFGYHNAIIRDDGLLVFLDFEYFGWDDPAKMIADFLLHPAMSLSLDQKKLFIKRLQPFFDKDPILVNRLPLVYLLLGLKWPLIMLNAFARPNVSDDIQGAQLKKAKLKLAETLRGYQAKIFPLNLLQ